MRRATHDSKRDTITRNDVPYAMRPWFFLPWLGFLTYMYVYMLIGDPTMRPGYFQAALATVCGIPMGLLYSVAHLMYARELSVMSQRDAKWKWISLFYQVPSSWGAWLAFGVALVGFLGVGLFGFNAVLYLAKLYYPGLLFAGLSPQSTGNAPGPDMYDLWPATIALYVGWILGISFARIVRWYYSLPEDA